MKQSDALVSEKGYVMVYPVMETLNSGSILAYVRVTAGQKHINVNHEEISELIEMLQYIQENYATLNKEEQDGRI